MHSVEIPYNICPPLLSVHSPLLLFFEISNIDPQFFIAIASIPTSHYSDK
jgi:hypothetical protein